MKYIYNGADIFPKLNTRYVTIIYSTQSRWIDVKTLTWGDLNATQWGKIEYIHQEQWIYVKTLMWGDLDATMWGKIERGY